MLLRPNIFATRKSYDKSFADIVKENALDPSCRGYVLAPITAIGYNMALLILYG
jgi:hypothetical protein